MKPGDYVLCIDDIFAGLAIKKGSIYQIENLGKDRLTLMGLKGTYNYTTWTLDRFIHLGATVSKLEKIIYNIPQD